MHERMSMSIDHIAEEGREKGQSHGLQARWCLVCLEVRGKRSRVSSRREIVHCRRVGYNRQREEQIEDLEELVAVTARRNPRTTNTYATSTISHRLCTVSREFSRPGTAIYRGAL
jgi:hypothetical protein